MHNIRIDDSLLKERCFERAYNCLIGRVQEFANNNNVQFFEAAKRFFSENYGYKYWCEIDVIFWFGYARMGEAKESLNGISLEQVMNRISSEQNEVCLPVAEVCLKTSYRRFIFLTETNRFFLDDGTYLGDNYLDIINKIFNHEIVIEPIRCDKIFDTLKRHGWSENKKQDISGIVEEYHEIGIELFPAAKAFYEIVPQGVYIDWFYTHGTSFQSVIIGDIKSQLRYLKEPQNYFKEIDEKLVKICRLQGYSSYTIFLSESGKFYVDFYKNKMYYITDDIYLFVQWFLMKWFT